MKILLIHQIFVTPDEGGGTRHYEMARYLVDMGHSVTVIASDVDYLSGKKKDKRREIRDGIEIIYSYTFSSVHRSIMHRAISFLSFAITSCINALKIKSVDIVWGTSPPLFQSVTSLFIAKIKRKSFVFEVRDLWLDFSEELGVVKNKYILSFFRMFERLLYRYSKKVMVNSPGFIPFVKKYVTEEDILLVPNGVITEEFRVNGIVSQEKKRKLGLAERFIVMYTGNIGVANDIESILSAAEFLKIYKDISFVIIGGGIKRDVFSNYCKKNNLSNVIFLNTVPKRELPEIISIADVCIATLKPIPLFRTTYPNKVFDYMAGGKPTVLAIDGVMREVIENSGGGIFVEPGSSRGIAQAVLEYYNNRSLIGRHGKNAREYVERYFERKEIAKGLERILEDVAG